MLNAISLAQAQPSQADIDAAAREAEILQREIRDRDAQQRLRDLESASPPTHIEVPLPSPITREPGPCLDIHHIDLKGVVLLGNERTESILARYRDTCMGIQEIESLLSDITRAYILKGYISARAYLPQQDLSSGTLIIEVIEGQVEGVRVDDGDKHSISISNVAPGVVGRPLNLRDLEQALDQINRLASNNAVFDVEPGSEPGDSIVVLKNDPTRAWRGLISYDNHGARNTGRGQWGLTIMGDNPLGFNDFISLSYRRSSPYRIETAASESKFLTYTLPYGYTTFNMSLSESSYVATIPAPSGTNLRTRGDSNSMIAGADRILHRDGANVLRGAATLTVKESDNYLEDILLEVSSRRLSIIDLDFSYTRITSSGVLSLQTGWAKGITDFGALRDQDNLPAWAPRAQFEKFKYGLNYMVPFTLGSADLTFTSSLFGQKAKNVLYGSEQISIGGIYSVRGFTNNTLAGDDGYYIRNDLASRHTLNIEGLPSGYIRPYLALDHGEVRNRVDGVPEGGLTGAATGFQLGIGIISLDVFHARPVSFPHFMTREGGETWLRVAIAL